METKVSGRNDPAPVGITVVACIEALCSELVASYKEIATAERDSLSPCHPERSGRSVATGAQSKDPEDFPLPCCVREFSRVLVGGLTVRDEENSADIIERIPCIGLVRETSSGSFDYAPMTIDTRDFSTRFAQEDRD